MIKSQKTISQQKMERNLITNNNKYFLFIKNNTHSYYQFIHLDINRQHPKKIQQVLADRQTILQPKQQYFFNINSLMINQINPLSNQYVTWITQKQYEQHVMFEHNPLHEVSQEHMNQRIHKFMAAITWKKQHLVMRGSGILISQNLILTCAHNIYHMQERAKNQNVKIYVGACGQLKKSYSVQKIYIPQKFYLQTKANRHLLDYALIKLKEKEQLNDYIPLSPYYKQPYSQHSSIAIYGYPTSAYRMIKRQSQIVQKVYQRGLVTKNKIIQIDEKKKIIQHCISTQPGHAGSPIIHIENQTDLRIIAIHKGAFRKKQQHSNLGILITSQLIDQLQKQAMAMGAQPFRIQQSKYAKYTRQAEEDISNHNYQQAIKKYRQLLQIYPHSFNIHYNLGCALKEQQNYKQAIQQFRKAVDLNPSFAQAYTNLGNCHKLTNRIEQAIDCYRKALAINPNDASAHYNFGIVLTAEGKIEEAIESYNKALQNNPNFYEAQNNLGRLLSQLNRNQQAINRYHKALQLSPLDDQVYNNLGVAYRELQDIKNAKKYFLKAIELNKKNVTALNNLQKVCDLKTFEKTEQKTKHSQTNVEQKQKHQQIRNLPEKKQQHLQEMITITELKKLVLSQSTENNIKQKTWIHKTFDKKYEEEY